MEKRWTIKKADQEKANELASELNIPAILGLLLVQRGIENFDQAKSFFRPSLEKLYDPFLMKGMQSAVERISKALDNKEKILVYGDYDVDGTCSVAMVYHFLSSLSDKLEYYIPDRYGEGYGLSDKGVDYAIDNDFSLVIILDCGIKSVAKIKRAAEANVDFIVCDHHLPGDEIPPAIAVLDPKQEDCSYPYKELCGCGVGFKLLEGLSEYMHLDKEKLYAYLDLVSLAISADIVPITDENRIICYYGLSRINASARIGIRALLPIKEKEKEYKVSDLVFTLAPRINAAGRIRSGKFAVQLLVEDDLQKASEIAQEIEDDNSYRRELDKDITQEALAQLREKEGYLERRSTVVYNENWHKGVVGIVASRLIEHYYKPTIVLTKSGETATGSARSVSGFDLYKALEECEGHLLQFGGHTHAAGMTMEIDKIEAFSESFERAVTNSILESQLIPEIKIDIEIDLDQLDHKLYRIIQQMAPFGPGNPEPLLSTSYVYDSGYSRKVGKEGEHLKLHIRQEGSKSIDAIAFNFGNFYEDIKNGTPFKIAYYIQENTWNGVTKLQLMVRDLQLM